MNTLVKSVVRKSANALGFELVRKAPGKMGADAYQDIKHLLSCTPEPILFDIGANVGNTVVEFKTLFPRSVIHCFEPGAIAFDQLKRVADAYPGVHAQPLGVGSSAGPKVLLEQGGPQWSSFLSPGEQRTARVTRETTVQVTTVDDYCTSEGIQRIDALKTDTQGFEYEVLKGAERMLQSNAIKLIYMEVIFGELYKGLPPFDEVFRFLHDRRFELVSFYRFHHRDNVASWSDALFINRSFAAPDVTGPPPHTSR